MKTLYLLFFVAFIQTCFGQAPIQRNQFTTNTTGILLGYITNTTLLGTPQTDADGEELMNGLSTSNMVLTTLGAVPHVATLTAMDSYAGAATALWVTDTNRGGLFLYDATRLTTNSGTLIQASGKTVGAWVRQCTYVMPEWFGAKGDGATDDTTAFTDAFAAMDDYHKEFRCKAGQHYYLGSNDTTFTLSSTRVYDFNNALLRRYRATTNNTGDLFYFPNGSDVIVRNLRFTTDTNGFLQNLGGTCSEPAGYTIPDRASTLILFDSLTATNALFENITLTNAYGAFQLYPSPSATRKFQHLKIRNLHMDGVPMPFYTGGIIDSTMENIYAVSPLFSDLCYAKYYHFVYDSPSDLYACSNVVWKNITIIGSTNGPPYTLWDSAASKNNLFSGIRLYNIGVGGSTGYGTILSDVYLDGVNSSALSANSSWWTLGGGGCINNVFIDYKEQDTLYDHSLILSARSESDKFVCNNITINNPTKRVLRLNGGQVDISNLSITGNNLTNYMVTTENGYAGGARFSNFDTYFVTAGSVMFDHHTSTGPFTVQVIGAKHKLGSYYASSPYSALGANSPLNLSDMELYNHLGANGVGRLVNQSSYGYTNVNVATATTFGNFINLMTPLGCAALAVDSTIAGFLLPRMAYSSKTNIANPVAGLQVWDSTVVAPASYNGSTWLTHLTESNTVAAIWKNVAAPTVPADFMGMYAADDASAANSTFHVKDEVGTVNELRESRGLVTLTSGAASNILVITNADNVYFGGTLQYTIYAVSATTNVTGSGKLLYQGGSRGTNTFCKVDDVQGTIAGGTATSGGVHASALTWTWSANYGVTNYVVVLQLTPTTDIAATTAFKAGYTVIDNSSIRLYQQ